MKNSVSGAKEGENMGRPSKTVGAAQGHRTKGEIEQRTEAEKALFTGMPIRESQTVAKDKAAHNEFLRVIEIMTAIEKNDAVFEAVINDYCLYWSDIERYLKMRRKIQRDKTVAGSTQYKLLFDCDRKIDGYRKKRFDIEKEMGFTVAAALRSIPKKAEKPKNPLQEILNGSGG